MNKDITIIIFSGDDSIDRSNTAGKLSIFLSNLNMPIKIITPYEPFEYNGYWNKINPLTYDDAMTFQVKELKNYFDTKFVMHCETDGHPINFDLWSDDFLKFDFIGAPWRIDWDLINNGRVGNMGCSIISKRFLDWVSIQEYNGMAGDVFICQHLKQKAKENGFTYADVQLALRFSMEHPIEIEWDRSKSFAKHIKYEEYS